MASSRVASASALLLLLAVAALCEAAAPQEPTPPGLDGDDECLADGGGEGCALAAFQLRASRKAAEVAEHRNKIPVTPPPFDYEVDEPTAPPPEKDDEEEDDDDEDDDEEDDDEDDEEEEEEKKPQKPKKDGAKEEEVDEDDLPGLPGIPSEEDEGGASGGDVVAAWAQCGGGDYEGPTACAKGSLCTKLDKFYAECVPKAEVARVIGEAKKAKAEQKANEKKDSEDEDGFQEPLDAQKAVPPMPKDKDTPSIVIKGNLLYDSKTGKRFFAKGVAYNPRFWAFDKRMMKKGNCTAGDPPVGKLEYAEDPTKDDLEETWKEALNGMAYMGANTVRLYNINPEVDHTPFMDYARSLGIYVIVPLTRHDWGWLPAGSPAPLCYTEDIEDYGNVGTNVLTSAKLIVKEFSKYDNTLLFTVANEMTVAEKNGYAAFPCVKALTRDIHRYQKQCGETMRRVPLMYADMDMGPPYREMVGRYMSCSLESPEDAVDVYGLNVYSWCDSEYPDGNGKHNFKFSPYSPIVDEFKHFDIPLIFSEFGCTEGEFQTYCPYKGGRTWPDVKTFFKEFKEIMSGAVAFEFSMEDNQFGLALTPGFTSDKKNEDHFYYLDTYYALKKEFSKHNASSKWDGADVEDCKWTPQEAGEMKYHHKPAACPTKSEVKMLFSDKGVSNAKPNWHHELPPTPKGADQDALAKCPVYEVDSALRAEACCHMKCDE